MNKHFLKRRCDIYIQLEYYPAGEKNARMPAAITWMDLEIIIQSEASQRQTSYDIADMWI